MFSLFPNETKKQALHDLTIRARGGIVIYLLVWLAISFWAGFPSSSPILFWLNTLIIMILAVSRVLHYQSVMSHPDQHVDSKIHMLVISILLNALHWGTLTAWIIINPAFVELQYPLIIILAAFAMGGTSTLSISRLISILFPLFIYFPSISTLAFTGFQAEDFLLAGLAIFSLIYIIDASRITHKDYWRAIRNHALAEERSESLERLSITDPLTQLKNRAYFIKRYNDEWKRCDRLQVPLSLMMIDLDHFKRINDQHGHLTGDECLRKIAVALRYEIPRETDTIARYGGEEFVILLPDTDLHDAQMIAQRIIKRIGEMRVSHEGSQIAMTCSIGLSTEIPDYQQNSQVLLRKADDALYQAKEQGRNKLVAHVDD